MDKQTALQFRPSPPGDGANQAVDESSSSSGVLECPNCHRALEEGARFCPYDGQLVDAPSKESGDPLLGFLVDGRYEVLANLGGGGMGVVYRVRHRVLRREFALKALRADLAREDRVAERFLREAQSAASIHHPNVCEITDFGQLPGGRPYFVMELLLGEPLSHALAAAGSLSVARTVNLIEQVASALEAAHRVGIVHRDLKPDNILIQGLGAEEHVKVVDFGLAQVTGQSRLTQPGVVFGTPHYMSPEQASGGEIDHRADIYALGVVMYEMLTGKVPFEADTYTGLLSQHLYLEPTAPSELIDRSEIGALEEIVLCCLRKDPARRYQHMSELLNDIRGVVRVDGGRVSIHSSRTPPPVNVEAPSWPGVDSSEISDELPFRTGSGPWPWVFGGLGALVGSVVVAMLWWNDPGEEANGNREQAAKEGTNPTPASVPTLQIREPTAARENSPALVNRPTSGPESASDNELSVAREKSSSRPSAPASREPQETHAVQEPPSPPRDPEPRPKRQSKPRKRSEFTASEIIDPWSQ